jgi:hypothetical protein
MKQDTIINATMIADPSSTMNKDSKRDPEMNLTKKGKPVLPPLRGRFRLQDEKSTQAWRMTRA